jgi:hypothetical protein
MRGYIALVKYLERIKKQRQGAGRAGGTARRVHSTYVKVSMKFRRAWRIGFCLIARKPRTRAAPSRVPR